MLERSPLVMLARHALRGEPALRLLLAVALIVGFVPYYWASGDIPTVSLTLYDDAFYYIKPAVLFWQLGHWSFDHVTATTGFHPLWMLVLTLAAGPFCLLGLEDTMLTVSSMLVLLLLILAAQLWYSTLRASDFGWRAALFGAFLVAGGSMDVATLGLESALLLACLGALALYLVLTEYRGYDGSPFALALLSVLVILSRVDHVVVVAGVLVLLLSHAPGRFKELFATGLLIVLMLLPYLAFDWVESGHLEPISGRTKQAWAQLDYERRHGSEPTLPNLVRDGELPQRIVETGRYWFRTASKATGLVTLKTLHPLPQLPLVRLAQVALLATFAIGAVNRIRRLRGRQARLVDLLGVLLVSGFLLLLMVMLRGMRMWPWYTATAEIGTTLALVCGLRAVAFRLRLAPAPALVIGAMLAMTATLVGASVEQRALRLANDFSTQGHRAGEWLASHAAPGRAAGWAVGRIGWYARRPVVNLEGLIADDAVLDASLAGRTQDYLQTHDIRFVVNHLPHAWIPDVSALLDPATCDALFEPRLTHWQLRLRPLIDTPESYRVEHTFAAEGDERTTVVFAVDSERLASHRARRAAWEAEVSRMARVLPAEDLILGTDHSKRRYARRTRGSAIAATVQRYRIPSTASSGASRALARIVNTTGEAGQLRSRIEGRESRATIEARCGWQVVDLGVLREEDRGGEAGAASEGVEITLVGVPDGVLVDELYLLPGADSREWPPADYPPPGA